MFMKLHVYSLFFFFFVLCVSRSMNKTFNTQNDRKTQNKDESDDNENNPQDDVDPENMQKNVMANKIQNITPLLLLPHRHHTNTHIQTQWRGAHNCSHGGKPTVKQFSFKKTKTL